MSDSEHQQAFQLLSNLKTPIVALSPSLEFLYGNPAFASLLGADPAKLLGKKLTSWVSQVHSQALEARMATLLTQGEAEELPLPNLQELFAAAPGPEFPLVGQLAFSRLPLDQEPSCVVVEFHLERRPHVGAQADLPPMVLGEAPTDLENNYRAKDRDSLLAEIHHRVKNNLAIINGLISLQLNKTDNPEVREPLREVNDRIRAIALIEESLYRHPNLERIPIRDYLQTLLRHLRGQYRLHEADFYIHAQIEEIYLPVSKAISMALVVNELLTNSIKYGHLPGLGGNLYLQLRHTSPQELYLEVADDGPSLEQGATYDSLKGRRGLGFEIVEALARQLQCHWNFETAKGFRFYLYCDLQ